MKTLTIKYRHLDGHSTVRDISQIENGPLLRAYCHLVGGMRTFLRPWIEWAIDKDTGKAVDLSGPVDAPIPKLEIAGKEYDAYELIEKFNPKDLKNKDMILQSLDQMDDRHLFHLSAALKMGRSAGAKAIKAAIKTRRGWPDFADVECGPDGLPKNSFGSNGRGAALHSLGKMNDPTLSKLVPALQYAGRFADAKAILDSITPKCEAASPEHMTIENEAAARNCPAGL
jgi:hypothetical protein